MALFQPPAAPEGYQYVVRDQKYVLVPNSELGEDICAATGRTWAEEARLYNIQNAPDGKKIAEPGDRFYQTAESMKNKGKQINNLGAKGVGLFFQLKNTSDTPGPSLQDTLSKIKSGDANADIGAALSKISEVAGGLPGNVSGDLTAARTQIAAKLAQAQRDLPRLTAQAQANQNLTTTLAASQGRAPTEAELKQAAGALSIFQDGPALLRSKAESIAKEVAKAGEEFGAAVPKSIKDAGGNISAGINKLVAAAKVAGQAITNAVGNVPTPTITDPISGLPVTNPAYTTFAANPANAATVTSFQNVFTKVKALATDLSTKFGEIETKQTSAVAGGITDLKAFAFASQLAQPATGVIAEAKSLSVNPTSFDSAQIKKAIAKATKFGTSIDTALFKNTKDADLTYTGDDGIVWDRTNAERLRRNLPGLAAIGSPRPVDPPLVPAGATPPKAPEDSVTALQPPREAAPVVEAKKAVFEKNPKEKISKEFANGYYNYMFIWKRAADAAKNELPANVEKWFGTEIPEGYKAMLDNAKKIETDKPDPASRTEEEKAAVARRSKYRSLYKENSRQWLQLEFMFARYNEVAAAYTTIYNAFNDDATYGSLPKIVEEVSTKDEGPKDWKYKIPSPAYESYQDFLDKKPYVPPPRT